MQDVSTEEGGLLASMSRPATFDMQNLYPLLTLENFEVYRMDNLRPPKWENDEPGVKLKGPPGPDRSGQARRTLGALKLAYWNVRTLNDDNQKRVAPERHSSLVVAMELCSNGLKKKKFRPGKTHKSDCKTPPPAAQGMG